MRSSMRRSSVRPALVLGFLVLVSGCAVLDVQMTSTPDTVHGGDPVTFDLKVTNRSQCPVSGAAVEILAFIPVDQFDAEFSIDIPPGAPQEILDFFQALRMFFDELCAGGTPDLPQPPMFSTSCARGQDDMVCTMSSALGSHEGSIGSMSFALLANQLQCKLDDTSVSCELHVPLRNGAAGAAGSGALMSKTLDCLTSGELEGEIIGAPAGALCVAGSIQSPDVLAPGEMATGQAIIPARSEGFVRSIALGFAGFDANGISGSIGVCKGGSEVGQPCQTENLNDCPGSTCGEGICDMGGNGGKGCDESTAAADCPGGSCILCTDVPDTGFLPIDCTTTYVAPETVPAMSPWGLAGLAAFLFACGTFFLRRRARRA